MVLSVPVSCLAHVRLTRFVLPSLPRQRNVSSQATEDVFEMDDSEQSLLAAMMLPVRGSSDVVGLSSARLKATPTCL